MYTMGTVIYRSKMHAGLKRNFQVMSGAAWLELLCRHIPDRYEHLASEESFAPWRPLPAFFGRGAGH